MAGLADGIEVGVLFVAEVGFQGQLGIADDGVHRGADFVTHVGQELALGLGGGFRLLRHGVGAEDGLLELVVDPDQLGVGLLDLGLGLPQLLLRLFIDEDLRHQTREDFQRSYCLGRGLTPGFAAVDRNHTDQGAASVDHLDEEIVLGVPGVIALGGLAHAEHRALPLYQVFLAMGDIIARLSNESGLIQGVAESFVGQLDPAQLLDVPFLDAGITDDITVGRAVLENRDHHPAIIGVLHDRLGDAGVNRLLVLHGDHRGGSQAQLLGLP